jgi:hypothetical protein
VAIQGYTAYLTGEETLGVGRGRSLVETELRRAEDRCRIIIAASGHLSGGGEACAVAASAAAGDGIGLVRTLSARERESRLQVSPMYYMILTFVWTLDECLGRVLGTNAWDVVSRY